MRETIDIVQFEELVTRRLEVALVPGEVRRTYGVQ